MIEATINSENLKKLEGENSQPLIPPQDMVRYFQSKLFILSLLGIFILLFIHFYKIEVPKHHWSCCMLGQLAGFKGFLCDARYYKKSIAHLNINRNIRNSLRKDLKEVQ